MKQSKYREEVNKILARLDEDNNQDQKPETEIPDTQEPIEDVYVYILRERESDQDEQVIDSVLTELDTNVPYAPTLQTTKVQARDEKKSTHIALLTMSFFIFLCLASITLQIHLILNLPVAIITIIPKSQTIALNATLQLGRVVPPITLSQERTVPTTGKGHQDAKAATGYITFYNGQFNQVTIQARTTLTGSDGIQIATDQDITVSGVDTSANPPTLGQVTVSAHTTSAGAQGNIAAYDINQTCCSTSILVKNTAPFHGGQDERDFRTVTKQDIANGDVPLKSTLAQSMQGALTGQAKSGEALVTPTCTPTVTADHRPGDEAEQVKVTVSETCSAVAYNTQELETRATALLSSLASKKLGSDYSLIGNVQITSLQATGKILAFSCQGMWAYALDTASQEQIKRIIAGKTKQEALTLLLSMPGIESASIHWNGFGDDTKLPKAPGYIHFQILIGI